MTPFDGIERLLIDGNNLLHRMSGDVDAGHVRLLLARLSGAVPSTLPTIVMLDGHAASGTDRLQRIRRNLDIQHAGSISADDALLNIIRDMHAHARAGVIIVTDDRSLTEKARHLGARVKRLDWLAPILESPPRPGAGTSIGRKGIKTPTEAAANDDEKQPWAPGRGATRKHGNAHKQSRGQKRDAG